MERAGFQQVTIWHGSGNVVTHGAVETGTMFVVADGVQSISEMQHTTDRYGIAFGWGRHLTTGKQQSQIRFQVLLRELLEVGFHEPLLGTVKGTLTGDVIPARSQQYAVLDAVDAFRQQNGKPALRAPFYACSIPLAPARKSRAAPRRPKRSRRSSRRCPHADQDGARDATGDQTSRRVGGEYAGGGHRSWCVADAVARWSADPRGRVGRRW
jgi:hypothetical protein